MKTKLHELLQHFPYLQRIKFGDGKADSKTTKHENFRAAMNWQHPYCVLAHYKRGERK